MQKKLLIIGIGGLTGSKIANLAKERYQIYGSYNLRNPNFEFANQFKMDLFDLNKIQQKISEINPEIIINTTGINNVDYCETHQEHAQKINVDALIEMKKISAKNNIKLIQLSSDSIFDGGKNESYVETDKANPINFYGKTKLEGEKIILSNENNLVVRASVLYGWLPENISEFESSSKKSLNFVQWLITELKNNRKVEIVKDEISSPIIVEDFARSILHLIELNEKGIFHAAPDLIINRFEFSKKIAEYLNLDTKLIFPTTIKKLGRKVSTGKNKSLNSKKLEKSGFDFLNLEESLELLEKQILASK